MPTSTAVIYTRSQKELKYSNGGINSEISLLIYYYKTYLKITAWLSNKKKPT